MYWLATDHLSARGLCSQSKRLSSAAGLCAGIGSALIRQLVNTGVEAGGETIELHILGVWQNVELVIFRN